ncbi:hypothetical protein [Methanococcus sp. CF]
MILKNLQPYTVIEVESTTIGEFLERLTDGKEAVETLKESGFEEFLESKYYIDGRTMVICENDGEAAKLADLANKTIFAEDPNFYARIRSARYEIFEIPTEMFNNARLTCESCGSDLLVSKPRKTYVCEKCGKVHPLTKKPKNLE